MTVQLINTKFILPNPYQTREGEDPLHVKSLAMSIFEQGMLQIPTGRIAPGQQGKSASKDTLVQLAFGHSRLAAYKFLADAGNEGFEFFAVNIVQLTDNQMFENAVAENLERKDLTPIEEARAMEKYQTEFHKTSKEVGDLFHLSDSAVRNKMRLLNLPEEIQTALREGKMTEGAARELLPWYDLPEAFRKDKNRMVTNDYRHPENDAVAEEALSGVTSERIHNLVSRAIENGRELAKAPWKWNEVLEGIGIVGLCKGCAFNFERDGKAFCTNETCFLLKKKAWVQRYMEQASLLSGIQILEDEKNDGSNYLNSFYEYKDQGLVGKIREARCENLRIIFDGYVGNHKEDQEDIIHLVKEGFPSAKVICVKRNGFCTCQRATEKGISLVTAEGEALAADELKEIDRARRQQDRLNNGLMDSMESATALLILKGLQAENVKTWAAIAKRIDYGSEYHKAIDDAEFVARVWELMAGKMAKANRWSSDPQNVLKQFNQYLAQLGLEALPWEVEDQKPKGKTLTEVFAEEEAKDA